jgi:hypothetical protein
MNDYERNKNKFYRASFFLSEFLLWLHSRSKQEYFSYIPSLHEEEGYVLAEFGSGAFLYLLGGDKCCPHLDKSYKQTIVIAVSPLLDKKLSFDKNASNVCHFYLNKQGDMSLGEGCDKRFEERVHNMLLFLYSYITNTECQSGYFDDLKSFTLDFFAKILADMKISIVMGSGASVQFGSLEWKKLISYLQRNITMQIDNRAKVLSSLNSNNLIDAGIAKEATDGFYEKLTDAVYNPNNINGSGYTFETGIHDDRSTMAAAILLLKNRYKDVLRIISYNYDDFLERSIKVYAPELTHVVSIYENNYLLAKGDLPLIHVHGFLAPDRQTSHQHESIILTESQYYDLYNNQLDFRVYSQLDSFKNSSCVFFGLSITDTYQRNLLDSTLNPFLFHFRFLLDTGLSDHDKLFLFKENLNMGMLVIWINSYSETYSLLEKCLSLPK